MISLRKCSNFFFLVLVLENESIKPSKLLIDFVIKKQKFKNKTVSFWGRQMLGFFG